MIQYEITSVDGFKAVSVLDHDGQVHVATQDHPNFDEIVDQCLFDEPDNINELFDVGNAIVKEFEKLTDRVSYSDGELFFDNEVVDSSLSRTIVKYLNDDNPDWLPLCRFLDYVKQNPDPGSIDQLYQWTKNHNVTITNNGEIIAYKGVRKTDEGFISQWEGHAIVDGTAVEGHIPNKEGSVVEMPRREVTYDPEVSCSTGLHVGSFDYAHNWSAGGLLLVAVNPRDVVSVPYDASGKKIRVCRYRVIHATDYEITDSLYEDEEEEDEDVDATHT